MENNISEQLFQAVETLIDKKFEQVKFDETIACIVQGKVANEDNLYEVKYNDSIIYKAIAKDGDKYDTGDQVYVNIPYGNYNKEEKIILGKYANNQEESLAYEDPFKRFVIDKTWQSDNVVVGDMIPVVLPEVSLPGYAFMGLQLGLTTNATSPWLVSVTLLRKDKTPILPDEVLELFGEPEKAISPYFISSEEIYGNVNGLLPIFKQKKLFNFPYSLQLSDIAYVKINIYKANKNDEIIVNDLQLSFGYDVNKYLDKPLHLYAEGNFNNNFVYLADGLIAGGKERPDIKVLLIDQKEKSIKTELAPNQSIKWYQYKIGEQGDTYGGAYWKYLGEQYDQSLILPAAAYTLDLDRPNSQIKAVLCEQTTTTFYKNSDTIYEQTIDQRKAPPEDSMYDKEQILFIGSIYYEWNEKEGNWKNIDDLKGSIYDYCLKKITTPSSGDLYIFHWTQEDSLYLGTSYYQYDGAVWRGVLNTDSSNWQKVAVSDPFVFTNQKAATANAEDIIRIVAPENKTYFLAYDNGSQVNNKPIKLTVEPTSGTWPFGDSDEPFKVVWKVINNGLIQGLSLSEDTKDIKDEIVINTENIKDISQPCYCYLTDKYDISAAAGINNVIACIINDKYQTFIELSFGELSTQGTNYSFKIEPIGTNYLPNVEEATQSFKAILTTSDGIELDASNYELEWDWEQSSSYYEKGSSEAIWEKDGEEFVQKQSESEALQKLLKSYINILEQETNNCQIALQKKFSNNQVFPTFNTMYDVSDIEQKYPLQIEVINSGDIYNIHILKATCKVNALYKNGDNSETRTVTLKALYPIEILYLTDIELGEYPKQLRVKGHFILNGGSDNTLLTELSTPYTVDGLGQETEHNDIEWSLLNQETNIPYTIIQNNEDNNYYLNLEEKIFTSTAYPSTIMATWNNNNDFYQQPLMLQMIKYDIGLTNEWAGGVVTIDNTESTIMATAVGAGHKDTSTNLFTGVLMGEFSQGTKVLNGLYGFNQGANTFGIDATTGNAFFKGRIEALSGSIGGWNIAPYATGTRGMNTYHTGIYADQPANEDGSFIRTGIKLSSNITDNAFYVAKLNTDITKSETIFGVRHDGTVVANRILIQASFNAETNIDVGSTLIKYPINKTKTTLTFGSADGSPTSSVYWFDGEGNQRAFYGHIINNVSSYKYGSIILGEDEPAYLYLGYSIPITEWADPTSEKTTKLFGWKLGPTDYTLSGQEFNIMARGMPNGLYISCLPGPGYFTPHISTGTIYDYEWTDKSPAKITIHASPYQTNPNYGARIIMESVERIEDGDPNIEGHTRIRLRTASIKASQPDERNYDNLHLHGRDGYLNYTWHAASAIAIDSDIKKKHDIQNLPSNYSQLFDLLRPVRYKYNNGTSNRYHSGLIAQEVEQALKNVGLTTADFAGLVIDDNTQDYSLRYVEFIILCIAEVQKLKARVKELEEKKEN